jgi:hypothetical protein
MAFSSARIVSLAYVLNVLALDWARIPTALCAFFLAYTVWSAAPDAAVMMFCTALVASILQDRVLRAMLRIRAKVQAYGTVFPTGTKVKLGFALNRAVNLIILAALVAELVSLGIVLGRALATQVDARTLILLILMLSSMLEAFAAIMRFVVTHRNLGLEFASPMLGLVLKNVPIKPHEMCDRSRAKFIVADRKPFALEEPGMQINGAGEILFDGEPEVS